jgi:hypothetical protein
VDHSQQHPDLLLLLLLLLLLQSILGTCRLPATASAGPNIPSGYYNRRPSGWLSGGWWANPFTWWPEGGSRGGQAGRK